MTTPTGAAEVAAAYTARLPFITAEVAAVATPRALPRLLADRSHIVELPCGPGHFLALYAAAGCRVTLIDGNPAMLALARSRALAAGIPTGRLHTRCALLAELPPLNGIDLAILPGGALNQLAAQTRLTDLLTRLRRALRDGACLVAQVCCRPGDGQADRATFLDPTHPDDVWRTDRRWPSPTVGAAVARQRRQHQERDGRYRVDFAYLAADGAVLHETTIELIILPTSVLAAILTTVGFTDVQLTPGRHRGLTDLVCTAAPHRRRPA